MISMTGAAEPNSSGSQRRAGASWQSRSGEPVILRRGAVTSTQDEAARQLAAGQAPPFALTARQQTAGRGRLGRAFASPEGASLSLTYVHRSGLAPAERGWFSLAAGLAAISALTEVLGLRSPQEIGLKWPNDLHTADGRKLGGILVEGRGADSVLVGIGLNLRGPVRQQDGAVLPGAAWLRGERGLLPAQTSTPSELPVLPEPPRLPALSDAVLSDEELRQRLESALVRALAQELSRLESTGGDGVRSGTHDRYTMTCLTLGCRVQVHPLGDVDTGGEQSRSWHGLARTIDGRGRLVVDREGAGQVAVDVGDVRHLRPEQSP